MISVHETEKVKFGRDREVPSGREASALPGQPTRRDLWLDRALAMPAGVLAAGPTGAGSAAALHRQNDGAGPGTAYARGGPLPSHRPSEEPRHRPTSPPPTPYGRGHRVAGAGRRSS